MSGEADIAWAAGLFEGEGTVCIYKISGRGRNPNARAALAMKDFGPVEKFARIERVARDG